MLSRYLVLVLSFMPINRPFIDSHAIHGGKHDSLSRTIATHKKQKIKIRYDSSTKRFILEIPGFKTIKVGRGYMNKLADWIISLR